MPKSNLGYLFAQAWQIGLPPWLFPRKRGTDISTTISTPNLPVKTSGREAPLPISSKFSKPFSKTQNSQPKWNILGGQPTWLGSRVSMRTTFGLDRFQVYYDWGLQGELELTWPEETTGHDFNYTHLMPTSCILKNRMTFDSTFKQSDNTNLHFGVSESHCGNLRSSGGFCKKSIPLCRSQLSHLIATMVLNGSGVCVQSFGSDWLLCLHLQTS